MSIPLEVLENLPTEVSKLQLADFIKLYVYAYLNFNLFTKLKTVNYSYN